MFNSERIRGERYMRNHKRLWNTRGCVVLLIIAASAFLSPHRTSIMDSIISQALATDPPYDPQEPCGGSEDCLCASAGSQSVACMKCADICKDAECGGCQCNGTSCPGTVTINGKSGPCGCIWGPGYMCSGTSASYAHACCTGCGNSGSLGVGCSSGSCIVHCGSAACPCSTPTEVSCACGTFEVGACYGMPGQGTCKKCPKPGNNSRCCDDGAQGGYPNYVSCYSNTYR